MKIGCCVNMFGDKENPVGSQWLHVVKQATCDYVELPLAQVMQLGDRVFQQLCRQLTEIELPCECCNNFFPASVRITGTRANQETIRKYAIQAIARAAQLGAHIIVFGSAGAKNVEEGFPYDQAYAQIVETLSFLAPLCHEKNITLVVEPLCQLESNIIVNLNEGDKLVQDVHDERVRLLTDYYHFTMESESLSRIEEVGQHLVHAHFADPDGRVLPLYSRVEYEKYFNKLREVNYKGRVSLEAYSKDPATELRLAVSVLRAAQS